MWLFSLGTILSLAAAPLFRRILRSSSWTDTPRADRHHRRPVSKAGGPAWLAAVAGSLVLGLLLGSPAGPLLLLLAALAAAFLLGRADDLGRIGPGWKWILQSALLGASAAGLLVLGAGAGEGVPQVRLLSAALLALALQTALGIFDNVDGALGSAAGSALVLVAVAGGPPWIAQAGLAGAGACLGFLVWNRPPARFFLGNAGSQPLALLTSLLVFLLLSGAAGKPSIRTYAVLLPLLWPLGDLVFVCAARWARGSSPWAGGRDHTTHRLARRLGSDRAVFALLLAAALGGAGLGAALLQGAR